MDNLTHIEIERKFLPEHIPFDISSFPRSPITQGYICSDPVIRVRQMGGAFFLTVKSSGRFVRDEFEMPISRNQYEKLWPKTEPGQVQKTRYRIPLDNTLVAELDIFGGSLDGLVLLEVEFPSVDIAHAFEPPGWFGKEVTCDRRYSNSHLMRNGIPS